MDDEATGPDQETTSGAERWEVTKPRTIDIADARSLTVALVSGAVDVIGRDEPGARVEIRSVGGAGLEVDAESGAIRIRTRASALGHGVRAEIGVAVSRDAFLDLRVVSATALVSGLRAGQRLETTSGEVTIDATAGPLRVQSVSGEVAVRSHSGPAELRTVSGDVTASGDLDRFHCTAVSAEVFLDAIAPDEVAVDTVSGDVTARLGPDRTADYEIATVSGQLHLDGTDHPTPRGAFRTRWNGSDGPATPVRIRTASGSVRVVHSERV